MADMKKQVMKMMDQMTRHQIA